MPQDRGGALGLSALVLASAEAFTATTGSPRAFREGIIVEALNLKTAAFFLAFIPNSSIPQAMSPRSSSCAG